MIKGSRWVQLILTQIRETETRMHLHEYDEDIPQLKLQQRKIRNLAGLDGR